MRDDVGARGLERTLEGQSDAGARMLCNDRSTDDATEGILACRQFSAKQTNKTRVSCRVRFWTSHDIIAQWIQEGLIVAARGEWCNERAPAMSLVAHLPSLDSTSRQVELLVETKAAKMAIIRPSCSKAILVRVVFAGKSRRRRDGRRWLAGYQINGVGMSHCVELG